MLLHFLEAVGKRPCEEADAVLEAWCSFAGLLSASGPSLHGTHYCFRLISTTSIS